MKCNPLGIATHITIALNCIRRGDLDGAASVINLAAFCPSAEALPTIVTGAASHLVTL
jgi:hypothetical protein